MNLTICKTLCNECPFSTSARKGWLGLHSLDGILVAQQESRLFSCHMLRKIDMKPRDVESGAVRICRGFIASASKSGLRFDESTEQGRALRKLQIRVEQEARENPEIILSRDEFEVHHGSHHPARRLPPEVRLRRMGYRV